MSSGAQKEAEAAFLRQKGDKSFREGNFQGALDSYMECIKGKDIRHMRISKEQALYLRIGFVCIIMKNFDDASAFFQKYVDMQEEGITPEKPVKFCELGSVYYCLGKFYTEVLFDYKKSISCFEKLRKLLMIKPGMFDESLVAEAKRNLERDMNKHRDMPYFKAFVINYYEVNCMNKAYDFLLYLSSSYKKLGKNEKTIETLDLYEQKYLKIHEEKCQSSEEKAKFYVLLYDLYSSLNMLEKKKKYDEKLRKINEELGFADDQMKLIHSGTPKECIKAFNMIIRSAKDEETVIKCYELLLSSP